MLFDEEGEVVDETPSADETPAADAAPPAWDGSVDTLLTQPWVPEDARPHLEKHLTAHKDAVTRRDFLDRVFAEDDRTAALTKELETTKGELASLKEALGKATEEVTSYKAKEEEAELSQQMQRLRTTYADIFDEKHATQDEKGEWRGPFEHFFKLLEAGYSEEQAAKMARALLPAREAPAAEVAAPAAEVKPAPPAKREVTVPKAVQAAGRSSNNPSATVNSAEANEDFDARARRMEQEERARQGMR